MQAIRGGLRGRCTSQSRGRGTTTQTAQREMGERGISQSRGRGTTNNGAGGRGIAFNVGGGLVTPPNTSGRGGNPQNTIRGRGIAFNFGGGLGTPPNVDGWKGNPHNAMGRIGIAQTGQGRGTPTVFVYTRGSQDESIITTTSIRYKSPIKKVKTHHK